MVVVAFAVVVHLFTVPVCVMCNESVSQCAVVKTDHFLVTLQAHSKNVTREFVFYSTKSRYGYVPKIGSAATCVIVCARESTPDYGDRLRALSTSYGIFNIKTCTF